MKMEEAVRKPAPFCQLLVPWTLGALAKTVSSNKHSLIAF